MNYLKYKKVIQSTNHSTLQGWTLSSDRRDSKCHISWGGILTKEGPLYTATSANRDENCARVIRISAVNRHQLSTYQWQTPVKGLLGHKEGTIFLRAMSVTRAMTAGIPHNFEVLGIIPASRRSGNRMKQTWGEQGGCLDPRAWYLHKALASRQRQIQGPPVPPWKR